MKKVTNILASFAILAIVAIFAISFQSSKGEKAVRWPFGDVNEVTVTVDDTIAATGLVKGFNYIDLNTDTNIVFNATVTENELGDFLYVEATESGVDADTITWGTGIEGALTILPSDKTVAVTFIFSGTEFQQISNNQID
jgi:hypothetical protein